MEKVAEEWGANPAEWRVLFSAVGVEHWGDIEVWDGKEWIDIYKVVHVPD